MESGFGMAHFVAHSDLLGRGVFVLLLGLSVASWYLIMVKSVDNWVMHKRADRFLKKFRDAASLQEMELMLDAQSGGEPFSLLASRALAVKRGNLVGTERLLAAGGMPEYLARVLRNGIDQEATKVERSLTVMASVGSVAPFIGLFGTVWGIYHALVQIGTSGQASLDKVAGPVGETLIMTAVGLAVAIPAVLAYNSFIRRNRVWLARLDNFAHDLYTLVAVDTRF